MWRWHRRSQIWSYFTEIFVKSIGNDVFMGWKRGCVFLIPCWHPLEYAKFFLFQFDIYWIDHNDDNNNLS